MTELIECALRQVHEQRSRLEQSSTALDAPFPLWMIFPSDLCGALRQPLHAAAAALLLGRGGLLHSRGMGFLSHRLADSHHDAVERASAAAQHLSCAVVEGFRLLSRSDARSRADGGVARSAWRLATGASRLRIMAPVAFWTVVLTALYPIWFAQSTLAHADIFAAACTMWGLVYALPDRDRQPWSQPRCGSPRRSCARRRPSRFPLTLAVIAAVERDSRRSRRCGCAVWREAAWLAGCALPLLRWYAWHFIKTGFLFGNPEFLRYNAQANLEPARILAAFGHRLLHLTAHMNMFVPSLLTIAAMMLNPRLDAEGHERPRISAPMLVADFDSSAGECAALQRAGRSTADALSAADVSAGAAGGGVDVLPPSAVLAGTGDAIGGGICRGLVYQSAVSFRARRQSCLCARDSPASWRGSRS